MKPSDLKKITECFYVTGNVVKYDANAHKCDNTVAILLRDILVSMKISLYDFSRCESWNILNQDNGTVIKYKLDNKEFDIKATNNILDKWHALAQDMSILPVEIPKMLIQYVKNSDQNILQTNIYYLDASTQNTICKNIVKMSSYNIHQKYRPIHCSFRHNGFFKSEQIGQSHSALNSGLELNKFMGVVHVLARKINSPADIGKEHAVVAVEYMKSYGQKKILIAHLQKDRNSGRIWIEYMDRSNLKKIQEQYEIASFKVTNEKCKELCKEITSYVNDSNKLKKDYKKYISSQNTDSTNCIVWIKDILSRLNIIHIKHYPVYRPSTIVQDLKAGIGFSLELINKSMFSNCTLS